MPQHPSFNAGEWSKFETRIRTYAKWCTKSKKGVLYLLSGTAFVSVGAQVGIDKKKNLKGVSTKGEIETRPGQASGDKIYVPKSMWTAGCCVSTFPKEAKSFAVIGNNVNDRNKMHTQQISVNILQKILEEDSFTAKNVNLYPKNRQCLEKNLEILPAYRKGGKEEEEEEEEGEGEKKWKEIKIMKMKKSKKEKNRNRVKLN